MKIGILQTGHAPEELAAERGDYDRIFSELLGGHGFGFAAYPVVDMVFPDSSADADGWLITGSKFGAYEDHPWIAPLEELIRDIHASKKPLVGICFGHQIIAQALGGKVEKFDGGWAVGHTVYDSSQGKLRLNSWHQDQVTQLPDGAKVLAGNDFCAYGIVAYGDHIWSMQPHPEFDNAFVEGLIRTRGRGLVPDEILDSAMDRIDATNDNPDMAAHIAAFFKQERA